MKPSTHELARRVVAAETVDDGRSETDAADRVEKAGGGAADRDRADRNAADRQPSAEGRTADREQQPERGAADGDQSAGHATVRKKTDGDVADREHATSDARPHCRRIDPAADVNDRPSGDRR